MSCSCPSFDASGRTGRFSSGRAGQQRQRSRSRPMVAKRPSHIAEVDRVERLTTKARAVRSGAGEALQPLHDSLVPASAQLGDPAPAAAPSASLSRSGRRAGRQKHPAPQEAYGKSYEAASSSADMPSSTHLQGRPGVGRDEMAAEAAAAPAAQAQQQQQQQAGFQMPQLELEVPPGLDLSYLSRLTTDQLHNLQLAAGHLSARLPKLELELPQMPLPRPPELSLELEGLDLSAARQQLAGAAQQLVQRPGKQQVRQRRGQHAAAQSQTQQAQQEGDRAAGQRQQSPQQAQQAVAAQQQQQQQQQAWEEEHSAGVPSAEAATPEEAGLGMASRLQQAAYSVMPSVQLPPLGLSQWRQGGITTWGWAVLGLAATLLLGAVRALLRKRSALQREAILEAQERARRAQFRERQRQRFQRALAAQGSIDTSVFASVSRKRGAPSLAGPPPKEKDKGLGGRTSLLGGLGRTITAAWRAADAVAAWGRGEKGEQGDASSSPAAAAAAAAEAKEANPFLRGMRPGATFSMDAPFDDNGLEEEDWEATGGEGDVFDPRSWDADTRRAWNSFVSSSKVRQGKLWDAADVDVGLPATQVDLNRED